MLCKHTGGAAPDLILSRWCMAWSGKTSWRKGPTPSQMKRSWPVFAGRGGGSSIGLESSEVLTLFSRDSEERLRGGTGGTRVGLPPQNEGQGKGMQVTWSDLLFRKNILAALCRIGRGERDQRWGDPFPVFSLNRDWEKGKGERDWKRNLTPKPHLALMGHLKYIGKVSTLHNWEEK